MIRPHCTGRNADATVVHFALLPSVRSVGGPDCHLASVVRSVDDERVFQLVCRIERIENLADTCIHMFDEGDVSDAFVGSVQFSLSDFFDPLVGRLDGCMWGIISEKKEEGLVVIFSFFDIVDPTTG